MANHKTYGSKREIYRDYQIAIKFGLDCGGLNQRDYEALFRKLQDDYGWLSYLFSREVGHLKQQYPISVGYFIEVPVRGDTGEKIGTKFLLLEHETGPEIFLPVIGAAAGAAAAWMALKAGEVAYKRFVEAVRPERLDKDFSRAREGLVV